jgi:uncharacterized RmlC-like cupin family protein
LFSSLGFDWRDVKMSEVHGELEITRAKELSLATGQSDGATRKSGVDRELTKASKIWMGQVSNEPGYASVAHHHGEAQTAGFVLKGEARIFYGEDYSQFVDMEEGDFVFVPPYFPHIEANRSEVNELVWLTARSPDNIVVNLD